MEGEGRMIPTGIGGAKLKFLDSDAGNTREKEGEEKASVNDPSSMKGEGRQPNRGAPIGISGAELKCLDSGAGNTREKEGEEKVSVNEPSSMKGEGRQPKRGVPTEIGGAKPKCLDSDAGLSRETEVEDTVAVKDALWLQLHKLKEQVKSMDGWLRALQKEQGGLSQSAGANRGAAEQAKEEGEEEEEDYAPDEAIGAAAEKARAEESQELEERVKANAVLQWAPCSGVRIKQGQPDQPDVANGAAAEKARADESPKPRQLLSRAGMVHYLDATGAWDYDLCECCFDRAISKRAQRALAIKSLEDVRGRHLGRKQPRCTPAAAPEQQQEADFRIFSGAKELQVLRGGHRLSAQEQVEWKEEWAPYYCAEAMLLEWMAEPRVGVLMDLGRIRSRLPSILAELGAGRQGKDDCFASMLVQVLGVKESADLQEGFGFFVQHVLSGGLEKVHGEGRGGGEKRASEETNAEGKGGCEGMGEGSADQTGRHAGLERVVGGGRLGERLSVGGLVDASHGKEDEMHGEEETESKVEVQGVAGKCRRLATAIATNAGLVPVDRPEPIKRLVPVNTNLVVAAFTYRARCILQFGAIPKPLEGSDVPLEWEEWPRGDEAAAKFPVNPKERCFGLGIVEDCSGPAEKRTSPQPPRHTSEAAGESRSARGKGCKAAGQECSVEATQSRASGKKAEASGNAEQRVTLPPARKNFPIVRCEADVELLVGLAGYVLDPPACTHCTRCSTDFMNFACSVAVIANFAYRPVSHLFARVLSAFPPASPGFVKLVECLDLPAPLPGPVNVRMLLERAEQVPLYFLIHMAVWCAHALLKNDMDEREGSGKGKGGTGGRLGVQSRWDGEEGQENGGEVWEEVVMWYSSVMAAWRFNVGSKGESEECRGSRKWERPERGWDITWILEAAIVPRYCEGLQGKRGTPTERSTGGSSSNLLKWGWAGGSSSNRSEKCKKGEEPAHLKAWPGGVKLVACLREMLLGEPCYRPASPATPPAATSTHAASSTCPAAAVSSRPAASPNPTSTSIGVPAASAAAAAAAASDDQGRVCGDAGCGRVEGGGGGKLRSRGGCGKVAYCSRGCQKTHWPSHKLTCPGRTSGKWRGKDGNRDGCEKSGKESGCEVSGDSDGKERWGNGGKMIAQEGAWTALKASARRVG
ncbi:unnamed protein product [Closterium sp. NIES-65]|nr:unnamed protein product [Closterium sp. NIES-65]